MAMRSWIVGLIVAGGSAQAALAGIASLNFWDAQVEYGVFADGGFATAPDQGLSSVPRGHQLAAWEMTDGVAHAETRSESTLEIDDLSPTRLFVSLDVSTASSATVGDNPDYEFERGVGEAYLESGVFEITVFEPARLTVVGAIFGGYAPGAHLLDPGEYTLDLTSPLARSYVDVGPGASAIHGSTLVASFEIVATPAPAGLGLFAALGWTSGRRVRRSVGRV